MKRLNQVTALKIRMKERDHLVIIERLKNTSYGCPRFKTTIVFLANDSESYFTAVYTFKGHYMSEQQEAEFIVNEYYKGLANND